MAVRKKMVFELCQDVEATMWGRRPCSHSATIHMNTHVQSPLQWKQMAPIGGHVGRTVNTLLALCQVLSSTRLLCCI